MKSSFEFRIFLSAVLIAGILFLASKEKDTPKPIVSSVDLGELLFSEKALSLDSSISCSSCHIPEFAFSDTLPFSNGVGGRFGLRNTPSIMNVKGRDIMFYDGRAKDIEDQVHFPIEDTNEMNVSYDEIIRRLNASPFYISAFYNVFKEKPNRFNVAKAIADFERSLETSNTPFDDYMSDKTNAMNASAIRGREIFLSDRALCFDCHFGPDFTGDEFKNIGLYDGKEWNDPGRFAITKDSADMGKFKVPGLRNIGVSAPYMHNGKFKTLVEVIEYYSNPYAFVKNPINIDSTMLQPINFTKEEKEDLLQFLLALTDRRFKNR